MASKSDDILVLKVDPPREPVQRRLRRAVGRYGERSHVLHTANGADDGRQRHEHRPRALLQKRQHRLEQAQDPRGVDVEVLGHVGRPRQAQRGEGVQRVDARVGYHDVELVDALGDQRRDDVGGVDFRLGVELDGDQAAAGSGGQFRQSLGVRRSRVTYCGDNDSAGSEKVLFDEGAAETWGSQSTLVRLQRAPPLGLLDEYSLPLFAPVTRIVDMMLVLSSGAGKERGSRKSTS